VTCVTRYADVHSATLRSSGAAEVIQADLAHGDSVSLLSSCLRAQRYDAVVHLAGGSPEMGCSCAEPELAQHLLAALASADGGNSSSSPLVIYVSALGVDSTADCLPGQSVEVLRPWLTQKERAETILRLTTTPVISSSSALDRSQTRRHQKRVFSPSPTMQQLQRCTAPSAAVI
jgi:hypothetical protein